MSQPARRWAPRIVVDPNVYVSAAISAGGPPAQLLEAAVEGQVVLLVSPLLLAELREVLERGKFRRWLALEDVEAFLQGLLLLAESVEDPAESLWSQVRPVCRDPDDDYLVALAEIEQAAMLVSGDGDLLALERPGLDVRTPRDAVEDIHYRHPWGDAFIPGETEQAWRQAEAEGHHQVLTTVSVLQLLLPESNAEDLLAALVTPESLPNWRAELAAIRDLARDRSMAMRPDYPAPDIAYVKLPPDSGDTLKATADVPLPDTIFVSLQHRPELPGLLAFGGWRVHGIGYSVVPPEDMPPAVAHP
jgi:putative PIN family toxin of toxin-antitoxin system